MKLKIQQIYSQRNPQWASELLGYNTNAIYSIGMYGCLITSFGMYINKNPHEMNDILKANGGYAAGSGNFIWSKCSVLGLTQTYLSPKYTGPVSSQGLTKIRESLDKGFPLVCEIDFNPATEQPDQHFVLLNGYEGDKIYACDPWTGQQIDLDIYGGPARAIIQFRAYDKELQKDTGIDEMTQCRIDRDGHYNNKMDVYRELGFDGVFNLTVAIEKIKMLMTMEQQVKMKDEQLRIAQEKIATLQDEAKVKQIELKTLQEDMQKLNERVAAAVADNQELQRKLEKAQENAHNPVYTGFKKWIFDTFLK